LQVKRGKRSLTTQQHRRKLFRKRKKKEKWERRLEEAMIERWREVKQNYHADIAADEEEAKRQLEINKQLQVEKETKVLLERRKRYESVEVTGDMYEQLLQDEFCEANEYTPSQHQNTIA